MNCDDPNTNTQIAKNKKMFNPLRCLPEECPARCEAGMGEPCCLDCGDQPNGYRNLGVKNLEKRILPIKLFKNQKSPPFFGH